MSKPIPSTSLEAAVRAHFGLTQDELARYLGITRGQVAHLEAGRRLPSAALVRQLMPLASLLPPPEETEPVAPVLPSSATLPDITAALLTALPNFGQLPAAPLRRRQRQAAAQAAALRWQLHKADKRTALHNRRQWGLALLQEILPQQVTTPSERTRIDRWLATLAADIAAAAPSPLHAATRALAILRVLVLEAEATAISQLMRGTGQQ